MPLPDRSNVLALLDTEERDEILLRLGAEQNLEGGIPLSQMMIGRLIGEIVRLRLPFVKMMSFGARQE